MLNAASMVELTEDQIEKLTESSAAKRDAYKEARNGIAERFADNKRVGLDTLLAYLDKAAEDYNKGTDPAYWRAA